MAGYSSPDSVIIVVYEVRERRGVRDVLRLVMSQYITGGDGNNMPR